MFDSGILLIDKPKGITSFDVIRKLRRITGIKKMGHTGTLDPFASGLLIICIGKATRLSSKIITEEKEYTATLKLGIKTDTGDMTGEVICIKELDGISVSKVEKLVPKILNIKQQIPPKFSALKVNGKKAYELARKKTDFQLQPRAVEIKKFQFEEIAIPELTYTALVSKGTYIRVLSETIGEMLKSCAVTTELRRISIGRISIENACRMEELNDQNWQEYLYPMINLFTGSAQIEISEQEKDDFKMGRRFVVNKNDVNEVIVVCAGQVVGFGEVEDKILKPRTVII
ncbi:tRNA pseudouridine(55) synthase TruB [Candidatus Cloacimonadota bacterium]